MANPDYSKWELVGPDTSATPDYASWDVVGGDSSPITQSLAQPGISDYGSAIARALAGGAGNFFDTTTRGYGDELLGTGSALVGSATSSLKDAASSFGGAGDFISNLGQLVRNPGLFGAKYFTKNKEPIAQEVAKAEQARNDYNEILGPYLSTASQIAPAFFEPSAALALTKNAGLATKIAAPAAETLTNVGLYSSGQDNNASLGERLASGYGGMMDFAGKAATDPISLQGAALFAPSALKAVEPVLEAGAKNAYLAGMGIRQSDIKNIKGDPTELIDRLRQEGAFAQGFDPQSVSDVLEAQAIAKNNELYDILKSADETGVRGAPSFEGTRKLIDKKTGTAYSEAKDIANREILAQMNDMETRGSGGLLSDWQKSKKSLQDEARASYRRATPSPRDEIDQALASDARQYIEDSADTLLPEKAGQVKEANRYLQDRASIGGALDRAIDADKVQTVGKFARDAFRTTGGFGVPILLSGGQYVLGDEKDPTKAFVTGLGAALATNRRGNFLVGDALRGAATLSQKSPLAAAAIENQFSPFGEQVPVEEDYPVFDLSPELAAKLMPKEAAFENKAIISEEAAPEMVKSAPKRKEERVPSISPDSIRSELLDSVMHVESRGNPKAVSPAGAEGAFQFKKSTALEQMDKLGLDRKEYDPSNVELQRKLASSYLSSLIGDFGPALGIAAYNAGPGSVAKAIKKAGTDDPNVVLTFLKPETQAYVPLVLNKFAELKGQA